MLTGLFACFHAAWLAAPFGFVQANAGQYFGVFVRNWERVGFANVRGLPLTPNIDSIAQGLPYLHHPPGLSWLYYVLGGHEWSMRLPSVVAAFVAGICWYRLTERRFGHWPATVSATVLAFCPCFSVVSQASYEILVIACGLVVMVELVQPMASRRGSLVVQVGAAFVGTWIDWGFAFLGLAAIPLVFGVDGCWRSLRRLAVPGAAALLAVLTIVLWTMWALAAPGVQQPKVSEVALGDLVASYMFRPVPSLAEAFEYVWYGMRRTWTWWLVLPAAIGIGFAMRRDLRLTMAAVATAVLPFVLLAVPPDMIWHTFAMPMVALACAGLARIGLRARRRWLVHATAFAAGAWVVGIAYASHALRQRTHTELFARLGEVLNEATRAPEEFACHGVPVGYGYYFANSRVQIGGVGLEAQLAALVADPECRGWSYLWLKVPELQRIAPGIEAFLAQFERRRVPELEGDVATFDGVIRIEEAWLVRLREAGR